MYWKCKRIWIEQKCTWHHTEVNFLQHFFCKAVKTQKKKIFLQFFRPRNVKHHNKHQSFFFFSQKIWQIREVTKTIQQVSTYWMSNRFLLNYGLMRANAPRHSVHILKWVFWWFEFKWKEEGERGNRRSFKTLEGLKRSNNFRERIRVNSLAFSYN